MALAYSDGQLLLQRYRITGVLGSGGFGTTYSAVDEGSGRQVAVKQLDLSRIDDWKAVELFEREARTLEQLSHERIPAYVDFVPVEGEASGFLIQALAPGRSLQAILDDRGAFTDEQVEAIAEQILEILEYLASLNPPVVHRDIKPANLLLDEDERIYLVDFGAVQDAATRTAEGGSTVAGTFGYMAPEQLHGLASPRSDLFGLGMTLIHLASGRDPTTINRKGLKIDFRGAVDLPPAFEDFIERLVEPNPDDRFESPTRALEFLRSEVPIRGSVSGLLDADSMARMVAEQARARRRQEQERLRRLEERAAKLVSALTLESTGDGVLLTIKPRRKITDYGWLIGSTIFLIINPGVFFVLPEFMGNLWPLFDGSTPEETAIRWSIYAGTLIFCAVALVRLFRSRPLRVRLTDEHFAIFRHGVDTPLAMGTRQGLQANVERHANSPEGTVTLTAYDEGWELLFHRRFRHLPLKDLETIETLLKPPGVA